MHFTSVRRAAVALALSTFALPSLLAAQSSGTVRGHVTDAATSRAIAEAQVLVEGTRLGAVTNASGDYTISNVPAGPRRVTVRRIGYEPFSTTVNVGAGTS